MLIFSLKYDEKLKEIELMNTQCRLAAPAAREKVKIKKNTILNPIPENSGDYNVGEGTICFFRILRGL